MEIGTTMIQFKCKLVATFFLIAIFGNTFVGRSQTIEELSDFDHILMWPGSFHQIICSKVHYTEAYSRSQKLSIDEYIEKSDDEFLEWANFSPDTDVLQITGTTEGEFVQIPPLSELPNLRAISFGRFIDKVDVDSFTAEISRCENLQFIKLNFDSYDSVRSIRMIEASLNVAPALVVSGFEGSWPKEWGEKLKFLGFSTHGIYGVDLKRRIAEISKYPLVGLALPDIGDLTLEDAKEIAKIKTLRQLFIFVSSSAEPGAFEVLGGLPNLEFLCISDQIEYEESTIVDELSKLRNVNEIGFIPERHRNDPHVVEKLLSIPNLTKLRVNIREDTMFLPREGHPNLKSLYIVGSDFKILPSLTRLSNLESLTVRGWASGSLDTLDLTGLVKMKHLEFDDVSLPTPPKGLALLKDLNYLSFTSSSNNQLHKDLRGLTKLEVLKVGGPTLQGYPKEVFENSNLKYIQLPIPNISKGVMTWAHLTNLETLKLGFPFYSNEELDEGELPKDVFQLPSISKISLNQSPQIARQALSGLLEGAEFHGDLDLSGSSIRELPGTKAEWQKVELESLNLRNNKLENFPDAILMAKIRKLDLSKNSKIKQFEILADTPADFKMLSILKSLSDTTTLRGEKHVALAVRKVMATFYDPIPEELVSYYVELSERYDPEGILGPAGLYYQANQALEKGDKSSFYNKINQLLSVDYEKVNSLKRYTNFALLHRSDYRYSNGDYKGALTDLQYLRKGAGATYFMTCGQLAGFWGGVPGMAMANFDVASKYISAELGQKLSNEREAFLRLQLAENYFLATDTASVFSQLDTVAIVIASTSEVGSERKSDIIEKAEAQAYISYFNLLATPNLEISHVQVFKNTFSDLDLGWDCKRTNRWVDQLEESKQEIYKSLQEKVCREEQVWR